VAARKKKTSGRRSRHPGKKVTEQQLKNLKPIKKGEVRNPKGINQYTGLRAIRERALKVIDKNFDDLSEKAVKMAKAGEPQMLKFLLQAGYEVRALQVLDDDGIAIDFAELAKKARDARS
jgi:hypothetical protein